MPDVQTDAFSALTLLVSALTLLVGRQEEQG